MTHDAFMSSNEERQRYWARSLKGWPPFARAKPNPVHFAIADLEHSGHVAHVITQNVDGLHQKAGSKCVTELHGTNHVVRCMGCGALGGRNDHQRLIGALNHWWMKRHDASVVPEWTINPNKSKSEKGGVALGLRADGDAELGEGIDYSEIRVPDCKICGGLIKPDVVYFGDIVPKDRVKRAADAIGSADMVLVVGSSLSVLSSYRLILQAKERDIPIAVVNMGETRAEIEGIEVLKIEEECGEVLDGLVASLKYSGRRV